MTRGPFGEGSWGIDGNGNYGLPKLAQGSDSAYLTYGSHAGAVIPAGVTHDVTRIEYKGNPAVRPDHVEIDYELSAEGIDPMKRVDHDFQVPDNVWDVDCSLRFTSETVKNFPQGVHSAYFEVPDTIKLMRELLRGVDRTVLVAEGLAPAPLVKTQSV